MKSAEAAWVGLKRIGSPQAAVVVVSALWAATLVIVFFSAPRLYSVPMIAATLFPLILYASRNPRLFFLIGMVATSVFGLSINFNRHIHVGGAPSFSIELMDLFLLPLVIFLVRDHALGYRSGHRFSPISLWWLGLIALGLLNMLLGPFRQFASFEVVRMLKCWLLFLVLINECVRERHFHHVVMALGWAMAVNVLVAGAQFALKRTLGLQALGEAAPEAVLGANLGVYLQAGQVYRVSGLVGHPNLFSAYLAMLLPIFTALIFTGHTVRTKVILALFSAGGLVSLLLTLSRTGWLAYAAAMLVVLGFVYFHPGLRDQFRRLKGGLMIAIAIAGLAAAGPIITRLTGSDSGALDFRYEWLQVAWKMVQDKPILGFGLNSFSYQIVGYTPYGVSRLVEMFGPVWPVVHNTYFLIWAEQGTVGLVLFLGLNLHLLWLAYQNTKYGLSTKVLMLNIGALAAVLAIMIDGLGSFYLRVPGPARVFWVVAGLIVASHYWNVRNLAWRQQRAAEPAPDSSIEDFNHLSSKHR